MSVVSVQTVFLLDLYVNKYKSLIFKQIKKQNYEKDIMFERSFGEPRKYQ